MNHRSAVMFTAYNDGETLLPMIDQVRRMTNDTVAIWVVDDGSTDHTVRIAQQKNCRLVKLPENRGVGAAYKAGFTTLVEDGSADFVIKIDADGQHRPEYIPRIISFLEGGAQYVVCSRFHPQSEHHATPLDRVLLNSTYAHVLSAITGWQVTDARSGFFGLPISLVRHLAPRLITKQYGIPMEVSLRIWSHQPDALHVELPHPALYRGHGNTRRAIQYDSETGDHKLQRHLAAFQALIATIEDLGMSSETVLRMMNAGTVPPQS